MTGGGRSGFQFRYETIRLPNETNAQPSTPLGDFQRFLSSPALVDFFRTLTGNIDFADAHASRYRAGHFLTAHDDAVQHMGRRAAYVLNLSPGGARIGAGCCCSAMPRAM